MRAHYQVNETMAERLERIGKTSEQHMMDWLQRRMKANSCKQSPDGLHEYILRADSVELKCRYCGEKL